MEDINQLWPQVEVAQRELWGKAPRRCLDEWENYDRDTFVWLQVRKYGTGIEAAYDRWLEQDPNPKRVTIDAIRKGMNKVGEFLWTDNI